MLSADELALSSSSHTAGHPPFICGFALFVGQMDITDLDHNPFPPTVGGLVTQDYVGCAAFLASLPS